MNAAVLHNGENVSYTSVTKKSFDTTPVYRNNAAYAIV